MNLGKIAWTKRQFAMQQRSSFWDGRAIHVRFRDGLAGYVDMGPFLERPDVIGSPFEPLRQEAFFLQMAVRDGLVQWPNGADLSPDSMYDAIRESGRWVV